MGRYINEIFLILGMAFSSSKAFFVMGSEYQMKAPPDYLQFVALFTNGKTK
jgi:hypothetical protein